MSDCSHDCNSCSKSCSERKPESFIEAPHEGSEIKKVIGVVSGKGGVGKSLVTSLLAILAQRQGKRTAIFDADITGPSIPRAFGLKEHAMADKLGIYPVKTSTGISVMSLNLLTENETDPVVWRGPLIAGTVRQFWTDVVWEDIDCMYIDMPPGTGDVALTVFQSIPLDGLIIVASPQELVGMIVSKAAKMAQMMDIPVLALVENMSYVQCPDCGKRISVFGESRAEEIAKNFDIPCVARIPIDPELAALCDAGRIEANQGQWLAELADEIVK